MPQPKYKPGGKSVVSKLAEAEVLVAVALVGSCRVVKAAAEQEWKAIQLARTKAQMLDARPTPSSKAPMFYPIQFQNELNGKWSGGG